MHVGSILVGFLLLTALGAVVAHPWRRSVRRQAVYTPSANPREEYATLVAAIRDLDFDYRAGVVTEADYGPLRDDLAAHAVALMREFDHQPSKEADTAAETSIDEQIEAAVSVLRTHRHTEQRSRGAGEHGGRGEQATFGENRPFTLAPPHLRPPAQAVCRECESAVRAGSRFCARCGASLERTCSVCGASVEPDDRFCGACGQSLVKVMA